jgi:hypothetical protein
MRSDASREGASAGNLHDLGQAASPGVDQRLQRDVFGLRFQSRQQATRSMFELRMHPLLRLVGDRLGIYLLLP